MGNTEIIREFTANIFDIINLRCYRKANAVNWKFRGWKKQRISRIVKLFKNYI